VADFLSAAWIGEMAEAAAAIDGLPGSGGHPGAPTTVEQVVLGTPFGDVRYRIEWSPAGVTVAPVPPTATAADDAEEVVADLVLVTDYPTARALHEGRTRAQDALAAGALKLRGSPEQLASAAAALDALAGAFASLRTRTTFADAAAPTGRSASGEG
jgi:hypothetical protein